MPSRVMVIGGGIVGLMTAYYCRRRGHQVTVLERDGRRRDGCSFGNAGMVVPSHFVPLAAPGMVKLGLMWMWNPESPFYIRPRFARDLWSWSWKFSRVCTRDHVARASIVLRDLHLASRLQFVELAEEFGDAFAFKQAGLLMLCATREGLEEETHTAKMAQGLGIPAEVLSAQQTAELEPNITMDIRGSVYFPQDCHLSPHRLMCVLEEQLEADPGCDLRWDSQVRDFDLDRTQRRIAAVRTGQATIDADQVVLATGAWSAGMTRNLGVNLPLQAGRGYSLTVSEPCELPKICAILTEARVAVTPIENSLRFGGTLELAGMREEISPRRVRGIIRSVPRYFPRFKPADFEGIVPWSGFRPCSPDGLPYLGRSAVWNNLVLATGHAMMGISLAPVTGQIVADIVSDQDPGFDLTMLSPDRYQPR